MHHGSFTNRDGRLAGTDAGLRKAGAENTCPEHSHSYNTSCEWPHLLILIINSHQILKSNIMLAYLSCYSQQQVLDTALGSSFSHQVAGWCTFWAFCRHVPVGGNSSEDWIILNKWLCHLSLKEIKNYNTNLNIYSVVKK